MRKKIVAANWKMNMTLAESERYIESLLLDLGDIREVDVVIVPPFTAIAQVTECLGKAQNIKVGAQNMHWEKNGPFTGEISAALLRDLFVRYVVLGHSERRTLFCETDEIVNRKVRAAHEATLRPIVCIGETLEQRDGGKVEKVLSKQLRAAWPVWKRKNCRKQSSLMNRCGQSERDVTPRLTRHKKPTLLSAIR
jgi:triosephosphate isomerase